MNISDDSSAISPSASLRVSAPSLASVRSQARVFGAERARPKPESRDFIQISVHEDFDTRTFNTIANQVTREVEIAGAKLIWDELDDHYGLMAYQGKSILDLRSLTIYADTVRIRSPLRFPGTNVVIHARVLIFEGRGCIDTSPIKHAQTQAVSPYQSDDGVPTDEDGTKTYVAADGQPGPNAGDIHLHVKNLVDENPELVRFICEGADGQDGETGGYRAYAPRLPDQPKDSPHLNPVTVADVKSRSSNFSPGAQDAQWFWPPYAKKIADRKTSIHEMELRGDVLNREQVVHLKLVARDDRFAWNFVMRTFFPFVKSDENPKGSFGCSALPPGMQMPCVDKVQQQLIEEVDPTRLRPGDGRDAYSSGSPGRGGDGGDVVLHGPASNLAKEKKCKLGGGKGGRSEEVVADPPGTPNPAFWLELLIVRRSTSLFAIQSERAADVLKLENVSGKSGKGALAQKAVDGHPGALKHVGDVVATHPNALSAVLAYAREAYRNGWREDASAILDSYVEELMDPAHASLEIMPMRTELVAMRSNMANNLDYFGNPVGWVPRLNVTTNFSLFKKERASALALLFFTQRMLNQWDTLERSQAFAVSQTAALEDEIDILQARIETSFESLAVAREELDEVTGEVFKVGSRLRVLMANLEGEVAERLKAQKMFQGFMKLAGGLAKSIPVGQPYLGIGGDVLSSIGDLDWLDEKGEFNWDTALESFEGFAKDLGDQTGDFLKAAEKDVLAKSDQSLDRQIRDATGSIKLLDGQVESVRSKLEEKWQSLRQGEVDRINGRLKQITNILDAQETPSPALRHEKETFEEELKRVASERMDAARLRLHEELARVTGEISVEEKARKDTLLQEIERLHAKKSDLKGQVEGFKEHAERVNDKTKKVFKNLDGLGDGIAGIGKGVRSLFATVDSDDPRVRDIMENLESSLDDVGGGAGFNADLMDEIRSVKSEIERINLKKQSVAGKFLGIQQEVSTACQMISSNLANRLKLSHQRQRTSWALGLGTRQYLVGMEQRARERLERAMYEFVCAYQYEYLRSVPDEFYNLDKWVKRLQAIEMAAGEDAPSDAQLREIDNEVLNDQYLALARDIVEKRQHYAAIKQNEYQMELDQGMLETLADSGTVTFNIIEDLQRGHFGMAEFRIIGLALDEFSMTQEDDVSSLSLNVDFSHSGISIIRSVEKDEGSGRDLVWFFQQRREDPPISWGFVYNWRMDDTTGDKGVGKLSANKSLEVDTDEELRKALTGDAIKFRDYWPSMFSNLTLAINPGQENPVSQIKSIEKVRFTVRYAVR